MKCRNMCAVALAAGMVFGGVTFGVEPNGMPATPEAHTSLAGKADGKGESTEKLIKQQLRHAASDPKSAADKVFVLMTACDNLKEIAAATAISGEATDPKVKELAKMIEDDHRQAQEKLQPIAQALGVQLPQQIGETEQLKLDVLTALPPEEMQKEYVVDQQADHARDILKDEAVAQSSTNDQVKELAKKNLPMLQHHEEMAQQCAKQLGVECNMQSLTASIK